MYARFALAGAVANLLGVLACAVFFTSLFGWDLSGAHGNSRRFSAFALLSFLLCEAIAGLVSTAIWFRVRVDQMIYVGIDDTDTLDDPGTNQLARHLSRTSQ